HVAEHVEPWSYLKFCYLRDVGWKGFTDGVDSGVFAVAPLARLNASEGMSTPVAQEAYEELCSTLGGKPVHYTLATHWARLVELVNPTEGIGVVEAPRGTLIHHYATDERGLITQANLIVATQNNAARIALSVDKA